MVSDKDLERSTVSNLGLENANKMSLYNSQRMTRGVWFHFPVPSNQLHCLCLILRRKRPEPVDLASTGSLNRVT